MSRLRLPTNREGVSERTHSSPLFYPDNFLQITERWGKKSTEPIETREEREKEETLMRTRFPKIGRRSR